MERYKKILKCDDLSDQQKKDVIRSLIYILDHFVEKAFLKPKINHDAPSACAPSKEYKREYSRFFTESPKRNRTSNRLKYKRLLQKAKKKRLSNYENI